MQHYALVCYSATPLSLDPAGPKFSPLKCETRSGKRPGASQVTALLRGNPDEPQPDGSYRIGFRAILRDPWVVRLVECSRL